MHVPRPTYRQPDAQEREQAAMHATELLTVDELPDLGLIRPTIFVWDQERESDRNEWTVWQRDLSFDRRCGRDGLHDWAAHGVRAGCRSGPRRSSSFGIL